MFYEKAINEKADGHRPSAPQEKLVGVFLVLLLRVLAVGIEEGRPRTLHVTDPLEPYVVHGIRGVRAVDRITKGTAHIPVMLRVQAEPPWRAFLNSVLPRSVWRHLKPLS